MRSTGGLLAILVTMFLALGMDSSANAALVTGPWTTTPGQGDGPIHDPNTSSPIVGDLVDDPGASSNAADGEMFDSPFSPVTLANTGDKVIFTGNVTLYGTVNSAATSATPRTQFRFGLFDGDETDPDDSGWVGYYASNKHGNAGTPSGVLARKPVANTSVYLSVTGQNVLASVQGDGTAASLFHDATYSLNMTIERNALGELLISSTLNGSNGFSQTLSATDTTASTAGTYTFDHVGFLLGGNLDTDRAQLSNLDVTLVAIPEASCVAMFSLVCGLMAAAKLRRMKSATEAN